MKRNNSKKDSSAKQQTIVLVGNTYRRNVNPIPVIAVKLVLAYMLTVGTVMSFINIYDIPFEFGSAIAQVLLFVTAFMPVFIFIKKRYALPAFAVGAAIVYFFFHITFLFSLTAGCFLRYSMFPSIPMRSLQERRILSAE